ncbi:MAG: D-aminoacyl-tRNA deacylase [Bacteroidales bacterium]|jgi:D-tyrosyl-tRNA(Tyr) deacylase
MRAVIQRTKQAEVEIGGKSVSGIEKGLTIFLGIENDDDQQDIEWLAGKICRLRIFDDQEGIMNLSVKDIMGDLLIVSQFTLHASTRKGNRPSYIKAARPEIAQPVYEKFVKVIKEEHQGKVETGEFGAEMKIHLVNDGPVTILIDTKSKE